MARPPLTLGLALAVAHLSACPSGPSRSAGQPAGLGRRVAAADARAVLASADGTQLAWLEGCRVARGQFLPPGTANCDLRVAPSSGGPSSRVAGAVTTLPQGFGWSPIGAALVALADYDYAAGTGTLVLWGDGAVRELARDVTFHGFGLRGELGFVAAGTLAVLQPGDAAPRAVRGAGDIASFDLSPADLQGCGGVRAGRIRLLARRTAAAGAQLLAADCRLEEATTIAVGRVAEYAFSVDGRSIAFSTQEKTGAALRLADASAGALRKDRVGGAVSRFAFAPHGGALAFVDDVAPGRQGNLYVAEQGQPAVRGAVEVGDLRWAAKAPRLAWLEAYDPRVRSGTLGVGGPRLAPRRFGRNVTDFDLSADGRFVAFLQHTTRGGYSVDLGLAAVDGSAPPAVVAQGVFGFAFSPDAKWLYYRTRCVRNAEGCDLERVPAAGLPKDGKPEPIAQGIKSFEFAPADPARLLVGWQRADRPALDIAVWQAGKLTRIDQMVLPGSARFLGPDSGRVGYAVTDPARAGVYVADVR